MSSQQPLAVRHLNNGLFSDYYLDDRVPKLPAWDDALFAAGKRCLHELRELRSVIQPDKLDESQLEELWIQPVLRVLGHHYAVQAKIRYRERGHRKPDYVFLATSAEARAITNKVYDPAEISHLLAVGDAKRWGANLDQAAPGERNPSQQIDEYLRYSERPWGILTDGRYWRLYHRDTSKYNTYYAVDLESLLAGDSVDAFLYFFAFFRLEAFTTDWLAEIRGGSSDFAEKLTDKLESEVYEALDLIAQGFLDYRRNKLAPDAATLNEIYQNSLLLLYRLLFIFYAESREILPLNDNAEYTSTRSLQAIKRIAANALDGRQALNPDSGSFYTRLKDLFFAIDEGDQSLDLPAYNGRLFSNKEHPFLDRNTVGDTYIIPAIDKLARVEDVGKRVSVDYRDLEVRHLGTVYEKLLEYQLDVATVPLTVQGDNELYTPAKADTPVVKQPGQVYLRTGSNERKVTGSYYTPDYIVRFIVEKTLEPLLTEITQRHATLDAEGIWQVNAPDALVAEILGLNVLDPATGSGHFIVDATAYIAEWLRSLGLRPTDLGAEDELIYWKRLVASSCIYAVDINPLAVELAKLSMWLTTLAKGRPLSFLDHHIRTGNSLVGTNLAAIDDSAVGIKDEQKRRKAAERRRQHEEQSGQVNMFSDDDLSAGVGFAVAQMSAIEITVANRVEDVKKQETLYNDLVGRLANWKQAADVWTARYFGLEITAEQWKAVRTFTTSGSVPPAVQTIVDRAAQIAAEQRFFHWELAFPEAFYDASGQPLAQPGFDAVIGNPPYVRQERIKPVKPYLQAHYAVSSGTADLFLYFYELGIRSLKAECRLGYITSGTYMNSNSAKSFRAYIHDNTGLEWVANFGENQPFKGAEMVYPTIAVLRAGKPKDTFHSLFVEGVVPREGLGDALEQGDWVDSLSEATGFEEWRFQPAELTRLFQKISGNRAGTLKEAVDGHLYRGIITGLNEAFIIDSTTRDRLIAEHPSSAEIIKPMLRGEDLRPWYQIDSEQFLILAHQGIDIDQYPAIKQHLSLFRDGLAKRWEAERSQIHWYELRPCAYYAEFEQRKIMWSEIAKLPRLSIDEAGHYASNSCFFIVSTSYPLDTLVAILQSRMYWFFISQIAIPLRLRGGLWQYKQFIQFMKRVPIPPLTAEQDSALAAIAEEITTLSRSRYALHQDFRQTLQSEFHASEISSRVALYRWWELTDDQALADEVQRQFKQAIPLKRRAEWRAHLAEETARHRALTDQIIALETRMNAIVYDAFKLDAAERDLIERTTKYPYGEV
jgi:type I restriction-modification system DNA methylase subunit